MMCFSEIIPEFTQHYVSKNVGQNGYLLAVCFCTEHSGKVPSDNGPFAITVWNGLRYHLFYSCSSFKLSVCI